MKNFFYRIILPIAILWSATIAVDFISRPSTFHVLLGVIAIGVNIYCIITFILSLVELFTKTNTKDLDNE